MHAFALMITTILNFVSLNTVKSGVFVRRNTESENNRAWLRREFSQPLHLYPLFFHFSELDQNFQVFHLYSSVVESFTSLCQKII